VNRVATVALLPVRCAAAVGLAVLSMAGGVLLALLAAAFVVAAVVLPLLAFGPPGLIITALAVALLGVIILAGRSIRRAFANVFGRHSARNHS